MTKFLSTAALALPLAFGANAALADEPLQVVVTTSMIGDAVEQVAGDRAEVVALMGPGVDPHAYRQTRSDIANMVAADLVLWHGLYLEAQMEDFLLHLGERKPVVAVGEGVEADQLLSHDDYDGRFDPHVWMDPELWPQVVLTVRDSLIEMDPEGEAAYRENADSHLAEIEELADYASQVLNSVPENQRVLVSAHDAFNYFGDAYGFEVVGIQGISTEAEAGLRRIEELVDLIVENEISAVFVESSVSDRNIRALIEGAAARGHDLSIGGQLFSDAMGQPDSYEGTYIGMIDHNATSIARALGGEAPELGMQGRLGAGS
ncbi:MAG: zinc ABC transporter substrate-binding protein [Pseudomonadota bacterium]